MQRIMDLIIVEAWIDRAKLRFRGGKRSGDYVNHARQVWWLPWLLRVHGDVLLCLSPQLNKQTVPHLLSLYSHKLR
jgi:hypothetical protein